MKVVSCYRVFVKVACFSYIPPLHIVIFHDYS